MKPHHKPWTAGEKPAVQKKVLDLLGGGRVIDHHAEPSRHDITIRLDHTPPTHRFHNHDVLLSITRNKDMHSHHIFTPDEKSVREAERIVDHTELEEFLRKVKTGEKLK